ncbi:MAG: hypothetical protein KC646_04885 [Candidatus Cloacimonetes bacterium]|nr:hypothetical protein [Candidatus Cloacimonadota bacterium]
MNFLFRFFLLHIIVIFVYSSPSQINTPQHKLQLNQEKLVFLLGQKVYDKGSIGQFTNETLFDCKGKANGLFEIVKEDQLNLYPSSRFKASQKFKCYPNSFLASKGVPSFQFMTENFQLKKIIYNYESNKLRTNLWFNEPIEYRALVKNLRMFTHIKNSKNKLKFAIFPKRASKSFVVDVAMQRDLLEGQSFTVEISQNLKSKDGIKFQSDYLGLIEPKSNSRFIKDDKKADLVLRDKPVFEAVSNGKIQFKIYLPQLLTNNKPLDYISVKPKLDLKMGVNEYNYYSYNDGSKSNCYITIEADFNPKTKYQILLKKGFATKHFELKKDIKIFAKTPDLEEYFKFVNEKVRLSSQNQTFEIEYANQDSVNFVLQKLLPQNYRYFVNFQSGNSDNFEKYSKVIVNKTTRLNGDKNRIINKKLNLAEIAQSNGGLYKLSAYATKENEQRLLDSRLFHVSDCGISAMMTKTALLVSTRSLKTSKPVSNTLIKIYSKNNQLIHQGFSDQDGLLTYKIQDKRNELYSIVADYDKQRSFLLMDYPIGKAIFETQLSDQYKGLIHLERGLIRPSESVSAAIVIKGYDFKSSALPIKFTIKDPSGTIIRSEDLKSVQVGVYETTIKSENFWKTGVYTCQIWIADTVIGSKSLQIESFLPPKVKNTIAIINKKLYQNENLELTLNSAYYFGAPAAGLKSEVKLSAFSKSTHLQNWSGYSFGDHRDLNNNDDYLLKNYPMIIPDNGKFQLDLPIKLNRKSSLVLDGLVSFSTFDDSKQINSYEGFTIFPSDRMVGLKQNFKNSAKTNKDHSFDVVIIDPKTNKKLAGEVEAKLFKKVWHYQYDSSRNYGGYSEQYVLLESKVVSLNQSLHYNLKDSGNYYLEVADLGGNHTSSISYYVSGWSYGGPSQNSSTNKLKISSPINKVKIDSSGVLRNELEVDIQGQMSGTLFIVIEDGDILYKKYYEMTGTTANIIIPVFKTNNQTFTVHAYLVRPANQINSVLSFRSYGSMNIVVAKDQFKLTPKIELQKMATSRQNIKVRVTQLTRGDVCFLSAVDQGIHDMIDEKFHNPFKTFIKQKKQSLEYYDFYNDLQYLSSNLERQSFGGDEPSNQRRKRHLSPEALNDRVKSFSYWSSVITADAKGEVQWSFPTNNFQGEVQVKALVLNSQKIGGTSAKLLVSDPIQAKLSLPRYFLQGDRLNVPFRIFNQSDNSHRIKMRVYINDKPVYLKNSLIRVKNNQNYSDNFTVNTSLYKTSDKLQVKVELSSDKDLNYTNSYEVPLLPATQSKSYSQMLALKSKKIINLPSTVFKTAKPKLIVSASKDPRKVLRKALDSLIAYPYGCAEQTSSKLLALYELSKISNSSELPVISSFIRAGVSKLLTMQKQNGSFGYWRNGDYVNSFASVYASDILLKLGSKKYVVSSDQKTLIVQSLASLVTNKDQPLIALYAAYILKKYSHLSRSQYHALFEQNKNTKELISLSLLFALSSNFDEQSRVLQLEKKLLKGLKNYQIKREYSNNFHSVNRDIAMALALYLQNNGNKIKVQSYLDGLFLKLSQSKLYSTQDKAWALSLFTEEMSKWPLAAGNPSITTNNKTFSIEAGTPLELTLSKPRLELNTTGGFSYVQIEVLYDKPLAMTKTDKSKRLHLETRLVDKNGSSVDISDLKVSQKVFREIKINSTEHLDNLVLVSKVPSCFESINPRLNKSFNLPKALTQKNITVNNLDIRDDRLISFMSVDKKGVYYHPLQVTFSGKCKLLDTKVEAMYDSRLSDSTMSAQSYTID